MNLHICGIPEIREFRHRNDITHVLSLLNAETTAARYGNEEIEQAETLFKSFQSHKRTIIRFDDIIRPVLRFVRPTHEHVECILNFGRDLTENDQVLVHCHAGISRSTAAASLILLQAYPQKSAASIFDWIARIRPVAYPNILLLELGGDILGRRDEIMEAARYKFDL